ncbi:occludin-like [Salarias fasciatus]|uniref:occludin-like n=1 Tax=Salarias fasciatus TaxID=181472 RepID=UPI0011765B10|nr:occludin-like isoform X2 [Salarias fasciatus]XP_029939426.1 occludin-like [Salarias fasciatus]
MMFDKQHYDSPPVYSPPFTAPSNNGYGPPGSFHGPQSDYNAYPPPPGSYYIEDKPQHFYKWLSPPGIVKAMMATVILLCLAIFACVASTLMWDIQYGYGAGLGYGAGIGYGSGYVGGSYGSGFGSYGGYGNYGNYGSYISPYSAKTAMIAIVAINFAGSLGFFIASFSKSNMFRSRKFFLAILISTIIMAILQGIINIVYIVGVNPMAQSSSSIIYNPLLALCQSLHQNSYSQMGGVGGFPYYNQYLYHYCFVDPQEGVAMVCGFLVVIAFGVAAFFAQRTRGKIWRYGKPNIYWDEPLVGGKASEGRDVEEWVNNVEESRSVQDAPTLLVSEKGGGLLNASANSVISYPPAKVDSSSYNGDAFDNNEYPERTTTRPLEVFSHGGGTSSSPSEETGGGRKPSAHRGKRRRRNPELDESQYETEYTTGGETGNELDSDELESVYPEITSDAQRHEYKREFDADLWEYKRLCAEMDDINDQLNKLSRQLDTLDETSVKYQTVAEEYNQLKDLKQTSDYQSKKKKCRRLRHKLFHIKRMVKDYDKNH